MADHKITDFVDQSAIDGLKRLKEEMIAVKDAYIQVASDLAKGLKVPVDGLEQLEKLTQQVAELQRQAAEATQRHSAALAEQSRIAANTTNTISRELMEQEKLNKANREAYTTGNKVKELLAQVNGTYKENIQNLLRLNSEIEANKKAQKDLEKALNEGKISLDQYKEAQINLVMQERELKQSKATLSTLLKNEEKEMGSVEGSYNNLSQKLELLKKAYKDMTDEEKASPLGKEMEDAIQTLDAHLKDLSADMGEFQRNTGNYAIAGASLKKDLKELVLEIANLSLQYNSLSDAEKSSAEGQAMRNHLQDLTERAGQLRDAIGDANQAISNAASDTRGIDQVAGSLQLAIDGFGLATGGAEMLGISTESLEKIQTKLQAAIAASNAVQGIQNALQSQSAVMQGVLLVQTRLRTAAENMHTAAQGRGTIATYALTAAQWAFNAAANANPIGLLVVAITALIAAAYGLVKAYQAIFSPSQQALDNYEKQKKALEELKDANDKLANSMKERGATEAEILKQSLLAKEEEAKRAKELFELAKQLYDDDEDEYKSALDGKKQAEEEFDDLKETALNKLLKIINDSHEEEKKSALGTYEYKRQLIQAELAQQKEIARVLYEQGKINEWVYKDICASLDKASQLKIEAVNSQEASANASAASSAADRKKKEAEELKKAVQAGEDAIVSIIADSLERQRQMEMLSYKRKLADLQEQLSTAGEKQTELRTSLLRQIEALEVEHDRNLASIDDAKLERMRNAELSYIETRLDIVEKGSAEELDLMSQRLSIEKAKELSAIDAMERDMTITTEQAEEMRLNIAEKYANQQLELRQDFASKQVEALQKRYANEMAIADNAYNKEVNQINAKYAEDLKAAGSNAKLKEQITAEHEEALSRLAQQYAQQRAQTTVDMLEASLNAEELSDEERERLARELAQAKIALEKSVTDAVVEETEKQVKADQDAADKRTEATARILQATSQAIGAMNSLASQLYDNRIQMIEDEQDANTAACEEEQERISNLVEQNVITQEEGEARKRAAEAATAKKNEELEKKKQAMKYKQAVWDKATSIAQAGIATALAITQALPNIILAAIIGAMGALQVATILATPIPKYAKGTSDHPGGFAIVGDGGRREIVSFGGQMYLTPDTPTLVEMPRGAEVFPDAERMMAASGLATAVALGGKDAPQVIVNNDYDDLKKEVASLGVLIKKQTKAQMRAANSAAYEQWKASAGL